MHADENASSSSFAGTSASSLPLLSGSGQGHAVTRDGVGVDDGGSSGGTVQLSPRRRRWLSDRSPLSLAAGGDSGGLYGDGGPEPRLISLYKAFFDGRRQKQSGLQATKSGELASSSAVLWLPVADFDLMTAGQLLRALQFCHQAVLSATPATAASQVEAAAADMASTHDSRGSPPPLSSPPSPAAHARVLVHCAAGMGRTGLALAGWRSAWGGIPPHQALSLPFGALPFAAAAASSVRRAPLEAVGKISASRGRALVLTDYVTILTAVSSLCCFPRRDGETAGGSSSSANVSEFEG